MITILLALVLIGTPLLVQTANASAIPDIPYNCIKALHVLLNITNANAIHLCQNAQFNSSSLPPHPMSCHTSPQCFVCTNLLTNITGEPQPNNLTDSTHKCDSFQYD